MNERLWVKPLLVAILSVAAALVTKMIDLAQISHLLPTIRAETVAVLLEVMAASMLVIATLSVTSMVSAYSSASNTATPRSFPLIVADDLSQNALSSFVGAFIFSIVALVSLKNGYYAQTGQFVLFVLTLLVFAWVIFTFVRWVDGIARLGRLGNTVDKLEQATARALQQRRRYPVLGGIARDSAAQPQGTAVYGTTIGYVQHIGIDTLQSCAEQTDARVHVAALPGTFAAPGRALAYVDSAAADDETLARVASAFTVGGERVFDDDPRFGLIVLSEVAGRALSPAVNDPGTAIDIIDTFVRLFADWEAAPEDDSAECRYDRVTVPPLSVHDMFADAFTAIARDGAASVEVVIKLQKALNALATLDDVPMKQAAVALAESSLQRAEQALTLAADLKAARAAAQLVADDTS